MKEAGQIGKFVWEVLKGSGILICIILLLGGIGQVVKNQSRITLNQVTILDGTIATYNKCSGPGINVSILEKKVDTSATF